MQKHFSLAMIGLALAAGSLTAQDVRPGTPPKTVLLELFTSEGCSSCPPADALLRQLNGTRTGSGDLIVGISEHVTYWNQLGWRDPFSSEIATARQQAYGQRFHQEDVYTPQMVVNGEAQVLGSDRVAVTRAMDRVRHTPAAIHIVSVKPEGDGLAVTFSLSGTANVDVYAVIAEDTASSQVLRGENSGHMLTHVAVASTFAKVAITGVTAEKTVHVPVAKPGGKRHLILFAQSSGLGPVLAVDSVPL